MVKDLDYYMSLDYELKLIEDDEEGGFTAYYPDLPGCITCGDTLECTLENAEDAKRVWLMATLEDGMEIKEPAVA